MRNAQHIKTVEETFRSLGCQNSVPCRGRYNVLNLRMRERKIKSE